MSAYLIVDMDVKDPALLEDYKKLTPATVAQFGGRFIVRGGAVGVLEGDWQPKRVVMIEFPDRASAEAWFDSPDYAPAKRMRQQAAQANIIIVEGQS